MATRDCFDRLSEELLDLIFANSLASSKDALVSDGKTPPLAAIRLTCKAWAVAGLHHVRRLRVRDATEARHVRRILDHANPNLLATLDARLGKRNEGAPAIVRELGRHAWEQMHLGGAARQAKVWESSTETLTKLSTNNWGKAFRKEAQEKAWKEATESRDFSYFESIASLPMLDASLVNCRGLSEVELTLDPSNLNEHLHFVSRRLWRLKAVQVLIVRPGRPERDGGASKSFICGAPHSRYSMGLFLLSVAFPRVRHVKFPDWRLPLGRDVRLTPSMDITGWRGVQTLELGIEGLPYEWSARILVEGIVDKLQPFNWPDLQSLIILGTFCTDGSVNPFHEEYKALVEAERRFLGDLNMLIIEHPVARLLGRTMYYESEMSAELWTEDDKEWQTFLNLPAIQAGGWVGQRGDLSNGATSLLTISRDKGADWSEPEEGDRPFDHEDAERAPDTDIETETDI